GLTRVERIEWLRAKPSRGRAAQLRGSSWGAALIREGRERRDVYRVRPHGPAASRFYRGAAVVEVTGGGTGGTGSSLCTVRDFGESSRAAATSALGPRAGSRRGATAPVRNRLRHGRPDGRTRAPGAGGPGLTHGRGFLGVHLTAPSPAPAWLVPPRT